MITDIMVPLDGTPADDLRLATAKNIADTFEGRVVGLFLNRLPPPAAPDLAGAADPAELLRLAKDVGDRIEADLTAREAQWTSGSSSLPSRISSAALPSPK